MTQRNIGALVLTTSALGLATVGCPPGGVGDPCIPEDEYRVGFGNYGVEEVNIESRSFQCETRVCLVNHFQGRVSCPYGQTAEDVAAGSRCIIPGGNPDKPDDRVMVPVAAQLVERQAGRSVYCSCRCDGPDDNARYCKCPDGYSCVRLVDDLGLGKGQLAGSYCVRSGTEYDSNKPPSQNVCSGDQCGPARPY
jgi:hypothetical protein